MAFIAIEVLQELGVIGFSWMKPIRRYMIFGFIIVFAVIWGVCTALREVAVYRSLVANQKFLMRSGKMASYNAELRHYEEIARIAEQFNIEELKHRKNRNCKGLNRTLKME